MHRFGKRAKTNKAKMFHRKMYTPSKLFIALGLAASLSACTAPQDDSVAGVGQVPGTVQFGYTNMPSAVDANTSQISKVRLQAIEDTASSLGARGALAWRGEQITSTLEQESGFLDRIFNFNSLMLPHNVFPPVIVQANGLYTQDDPTTVRMADKTYKILLPAHFVTVPPTWRTYLSMEYSKPTLPNNSLLPKSKPEVILWNRFYKVGWENGLQQANMIFNQNLDRIKRDYNGVILYHKLYTQKMISAPFISQAHLGITGDSDAIRINDRVVRITAASAIQTNTNKWQPIITN